MHLKDECVCVVGVRGGQEKGEGGGWEKSRKGKKNKKKGSKADEKDVISLVAVGAHLRPFASGLKPAAESISAMYNDRLSQQHGRWPRRQNDSPVTPPQRRNAGNL